MDEQRDEDLERQLCGYLDGQLSRREQARLEKRLAGDEALREELKRYAALDGHLAALGAEEVEGIDYDLQRAEIIAAVERKVLLARARRRRLLFRPVLGALAAAATVLLLASVAVMVFVPKRPVQPVGPAVHVELVRAAEPTAPDAEVIVRIEHVGSDEVSPVAVEDTLPAEALAGTVVVSVGRGGAARPALLAEPFVIY